MAQEFSNDALVGLASISAGLGVLVTKLAETVVRATVASFKKEKENDTQTSTSSKKVPNECVCKQEAVVAGIGVSVGVYGKRIETIEQDLAKMREHSREDNQLQREEFDKLRLAISEVKDIVHSVEITISQVTTVLKLLEDKG